MRATLRQERLDVAQYLRDSRVLAVQEIRRFIPTGSALGPVLYDLMLEYPLRDAKGLRPALCLATCRALGGSVQAALPSAAVIELYHNAFLVHDDIEDGSSQRRDLPTLHREHGIPVALNVGDGMLALAIDPLLENTQRIGLGKALRVLEVVARMARETAEGQALELDWIRRKTWSLSDHDYCEMVVKKTAWYSFVAPLRIGAIVAGATTEQSLLLERFGRALGIAFQIRDDLLNLIAEGTSYGKDRLGDLWEGKRTLILLHMLRSVSSSERRWAEAALERPHPRSERASAQEALLRELEAQGHLTETGRRILSARSAEGGEDVAFKSEADVWELERLIRRCGSLRYADAVCRAHAREAGELLVEARAWLHASIHSDFLEALIDFTIARAS